MPRTYQPKFNLDGTLNARYLARKRPSGTPRKSLFERGEFIAWDGEGVTDQKTQRHRYVMLLNSVNAYPLIDTDGISTVDALETLCTVGEENRRAIHVVFGGGYDVNMMLGDCTYSQVEKIWAGEWVTVGGGRYAVNYRARKSFSVRRVLSRQEHSGRRSSIVLWDVFGFFQSTFVDAVAKYIGNSDALERIKKRKAERSTFHASQLPEIEAYCFEECGMLVALMQRLRDYLATAELPISRWDGAGACAASLLKREGVHDHKRAREETPRQVMHAVQCAYAGGRTEIVRYGNAHDTAIYHYDINSAYPAAMRACPSLAVGYWSQRAPRDANAFGLVRVQWDFRDAPMYPFFWRANDLAIYYPQQGTGWVWLPEYYAARDAMAAGVLRGTLNVQEHWTWQTASKAKPFTWIDPLFALRAQWKRDGVGAEKVLKLAINSLYGKTAQHVGGTAHEPPRYHQLEWAGYITSMTRALVYRACALSFKNGKRWPRIIMVATDGVYSLDPLTLPCSNKLGEWEAQTHTGLTVVQSGVYWTDDGSEAKSFCRGFDKGSLSRDAIIKAWRRGARTYDASLTRFVTMGSGLVTRDAFRERWRQWRTCPRILKLSPDGTKRYTAHSWERGNPSRALIETVAAIPASQAAGQIESAMYPLPWDATAAMRDDTFDGAALRIVEQEAFDSAL